jgi:DNA topoisomerase IB
VLAREWEIVQAARDGIGAYAPLSPRIEGADNQLTPEQSTALDSILWSADFITLFRGAAGTGKSFVLKRVQQALNAAGSESVVLAPQRQQVIDLNRDGLTGTATVAECLQRRDLPDRAIVIVDEAGQLSGRQLFDLIDLVRDRRGRLILCGDTRQHGPIEASDALRAIERYSGLRAAEISEIRRQDARRGRTMAERKRIKTYRESVEAAAAGDLSRSFRKLEALGAIIECDPAGQSERLTNAYLEIAKSGESAIVISQTRAEVRSVNDAIREQLRDRGLLAGDESAVTALEQMDLTEAQKLHLRQSCNCSSGHLFRIGNEEYARENKSFGLTTMRTRHVEVEWAKLSFSFFGKSGVKHEVDVSDRRLAKIIRKLQDLPGQEIFQFVDEDGEVRNLTSQDVNDYLRQISGEDFTAKDFRTWAGTALAAMALNGQEAFENKTQAKKNIKDAVAAVAKILGNTPAVCRKCYVHPAVLETYLDGGVIDGLKQKTEEALSENLDDLRSEEAAVMSFLQARLAKSKA